MDKITFIKSGSHAQKSPSGLKFEIFSVAEGNVSRSSQYFSRGCCHCRISQTVNPGQGKMKSFAQGQPAAELRANWAFMSPCSVFCTLPALLLHFPLLSFSITLFLWLAGCSFGFALLTASMICRSASAESPPGGGKEWVDQALGRKRNPNKFLPCHNPTPKINTPPEESHALTFVVVKGWFTPFSRTAQALFGMSALSLSLCRPQSMKVKLG